MPHSHLSELSDSLLARARGIRLACFDIDGTLTDGSLYFDDHGVQGKTFHVRDGLGISLLRKTGVQVAFITARAGNVTAHRARDLGVELYITQDKLGKVRELIAAAGLGLHEVAFMGDDLADLPVLRACGLATVPADAHPWTAAHAHWRTQAAGGKGAARELCDLILAAQDHAAGLIQQGHG